jgi:hypothetical protein
MSRTSSAVLNHQLTSFAVGHMNDIRDVNSLVERLCPTVSVPGTTGQFKKFDEKNSFQIYNTERAMGGDPKRMEFGATDGTFNCKPHALEITIDKEERRQVGESNAVGQQLLDQGKVKALINVTSLSRVKRIVDEVLTSVAALGGNWGKWTNPDIDPIDQLDEQLDNLTKEVGSTQNIKMELDVTAWRILRNHAKVKARTNGVKVGGITLQDFNNLLMLPVDVKVSSIVYNAAQLGQADDKRRVLASTVLLHYSQPNPTIYDPSPFKCFTSGQGNQVAAVRSYMSPNGFWDGHVIDWSEDIEQTSTLGIRRLNIS